MKRFYLHAILCFISFPPTESFIDEEDLSFAVRELQGKVKLLENQTKCGKYD